MIPKRITSLSRRWKYPRVYRVLRMDILIIFTWVQVSISINLLTLQSIATEEGSLRVYDLSSYKVIKAIRSLGAEVSSVVCLKRPGSELRDVWLACGRRASRFFP